MKTIVLSLVLLISMASVIEAHPPGARVGTYGYNRGYASGYYQGYGQGNYNRAYYNYRHSPTYAPVYNSPIYNPYLYRGGVGYGTWYYQQSVVDPWYNYYYGYGY